ncbi:MAG: 2-amino-4-hydroxy-6-hydroxymethyldihydropteridine diphosphokinase [Deltaproteobacteria bacterium]|nr:2-amino-4-hydroxy-6-hydroxymethyldihydropteridine diphosphokinase [Candidatus Anaeroferrophillacea bacterium]
MAKVCLGIGANVGDRSAAIAVAGERLNELPEVRIVGRSRRYETAPVGGVTQGDFINAALMIETGLPPHALLHRLLDIEARLGRRRTVRWGPRIIDLDILFYDSLVLRTAELTIPHPELHRRGFVLYPLADIAATLVHPELGLEIRVLLQRYDAGAGGSGPPVVPLPET